MTAPDLPRGFMVLQGNRLEDLRDLLVSTLQRQPLGPLEPEVMLVQSNGMKHWLELALASDEALGICAATRMALPSAFLWQAYRAVLGPQQVPEQLALDKPALLWRLWRVLPQWVAQRAVYAPLQRYLASDADGRKRYQLAQQLADVLDGYQSYRADWLADWEAGQDQLRNPHGQGMPLPDDQRWQAQLWRDVLADLAQGGLASNHVSRADVHQRFMQALRQWPAQRLRPAGLPPRITVFGISSLPMQQVEALAALGQLCQVLLFAQNPCQYHWGDVVEGREWLRQLERRRREGKPGQQTLLAPELLHTQAHPLLAAWGQQGRDHLHLLDAFDLPPQYRQRFDTIDVFVDPAAETKPTRLARLQADILHLNPPPAEPEDLPPDGSIVLTMTHSHQREVEVLHDQLLAWFDADATLKPSDVMVMVPDMAAFAPHIQAVFGRFVPGMLRHIPYSVADQSASQLPLARALAALLQLPQSRVTLADWMDAFEAPAMRQRFGLGEDDVDLLRTWLVDAGVRWGLDAEHRRHWGLPAGMSDVDQNTWSFGLRRMLLGYAMGDGPAWQGVAPLGAVGGLSARLAGALAQWLDAMDATWRDLQQARTPGGWAATLRGLVDRFFQPVDDTEERELQRLVAPLGPWLQQCATAGLDEPVPLVVVRDHLQAQWEAAALHQRFFGGGVQFATLMPMRSIPFRVVCLLGMNDGDYPRRTTPRDFDLMSTYRRPGDRSRREDDRYLFLEALLSARERLWISWCGRRASDDAEQPPSVLVAQLMDACAAYWQDPPQPCLQPLQPFSARYFEPAGPGAQPLFSTYDTDWQAAHNGPQPPAPDGAAAPMPHALDLPSLERFVKEPVEWHWRERLGVRFPALDELPDDAEPFTLDGLQRHRLGAELLRSGDPAQAQETIHLRGELPLGGVGQRHARALRREADTVLERAQGWLAHYHQTARPVNVSWTVGAHTITGVIEDLRAAPAGLESDCLGTWLQCEMRTGAVTHKVGGALAPRADLLRAAWVRHVALCATGTPVTTALLGLDNAVWLKPMPAGQAQALGERWLAATQEAWQAPPPVSGKAALAYEQARQLADGDDRSTHWRAARDVFEGTHLRTGEQERSPYLARSIATFDDMTDILPRWAALLYEDLLRHARLGWPPGLNTGDDNEEGSA
ncbi:exodeoxyribonuclease V subunit gamma [Hydrogenophaga aquatica]